MKIFDVYKRTYELNEILKQNNQRALNPLTSHCLECFLEYCQYY